MKFRDLFSFGRKHQEAVVLPPNEIDPYRPQCPFYGFTTAMGMMLDSRGNGCGLSEGHTPCYMKINGVVPVWDDCDINTSDNRETLATFGEGIRVFPDELSPDRPPTEGWTGIPLNEWLDLFANR